MIQLARSDWAGEIAFLMATIGLMNARNVVETVSTDYRKLNKAQGRGARSRCCSSITSSRFNTVSSDSWIRSAGCRVHRCAVTSWPGTGRFERPGFISGARFPGAISTRAPSAKPMRYIPDGFRIEFFCRGQND